MSLSPKKPQAQPALKLSGAGLMGKSGPEAIIPLRRDSEGRLSEASGIPAKPKRSTLPADWTEYHDSRLRNAKGRYGQIAKLSDEWGIATGALVARWHLLRAGAAPARVEVKQVKPAKPILREPMPFERMRAAVTPQMVGVVDYLQSRGEVYAAQASWDLRMARNALMRCLERNESRLRAAGWHVKITLEGQQRNLLKLEMLS
ncbi:MAG: hypothetical protein RIA08_09885 [Roseovarius sp.]|uniref:hypothetical protein n=1 Tax=Roseovarius sp. TaxID=1486281 RepID=UPI0032EEDCE2